MEEKQKRKIHFDILRILAAFSVVMLHASAQFWYELDIRSTEWIIANAYDALFRFGVPIFVMISGAMFLAPDYQLDIKRLYRHNIIRMIVVYAVWCIVYGLYDARNFDIAVVGIKPLLREILLGRYHLWFLPMIVGIYVLLPVLKGWIEKADRCQVEYFLGLFFVLQILRETLRALTMSDELHAILDLGEVELVCGYVGYFVWGYYLAHVGVSGSVKKWIYRLFVPAAVINVVVGTLLSWRAGEPKGYFFDCYGICTFLMVTGLFLLAVDRGSEHSYGAKSAKVIKELSADTLGAYLMHIGFMEISRPLGIHSNMLPNVIGIPVYALLCFGICLAMAAVLRRIPLIGKYLC